MITCNNCDNKMILEKVMDCNDCLYKEYYCNICNYKVGIAEALDKYKYITLDNLIEA